MHQLSRIHALRSVLPCAMTALVGLLACACAVDVGASDVALSEQAIALEPSAASADSIAASAERSKRERTVTARLREGAIKGKRVGDVGVFLGIPYAEPPVDGLRFRPPQPRKSWSGTRSATEPGPACAQPASPIAAQGPQSEDCLYLNVYAPIGVSDAPVLVFIHGGGFTTGAGAQYDGAKLAELGQVIVVTINYRLGPLGFLSLPELDAERDDAPSGNDGMRDQQLALGWVRRNIAAFGGDRGEVTVFGQSAGSISACIQMVSPLSRKLARRFILQSGSCEIAAGVATLEQARDTSARLADAFCPGERDVVACLRDVPASELSAFSVGAGFFALGWRPVINPDDPLLPQSPTALIEAGDYNDGEIIIGSDAREFGSFQLTGAPTAMNIGQLNATIDGLFGPAAARVKQQYTAASDADANAVLVRLASDFLFRCPARQLARRTTAQGSRVFLYHFEEGDAFHGYELPYVFGVQIPPVGPMTIVDSVRQNMQSAFTSFAASGKARPFAADGTKLPRWPAYKTRTDRHIALKRNVTVGSRLSESDCNFLESIGAVR